MKALFDTNILVDYLNGHAEAKKELALFKKRAISRITWIELLVGAHSTEEEITIRDFLDENFELLEITPEIALLAVQIRKSTKQKLPDALILASAEQHYCLLITRDTKAFSTQNPSIRIPY